MPCLEEAGLPSLSPHQNPAVEASTEVIDVALDMVIEAYEKKYGPISASESRISASDIIRSRKK